LPDPLLEPLLGALLRPPWADPAEPRVPCPGRELVPAALEPDGADAEVCPMPVSVPPIPPAASRAPVAGIPGLAVLDDELAAP